MNFLTQVEKSRMATNNMVKALAEAEVIREWPLKIKVGEETRNVSGLFCIDEQKLNSLEDEQFLTLRKAGALPLAYAQLMSMDNIQILEKLNQMRQKAAEPELDLEDVDGLNFDWDKIKI